MAKLGVQLAGSQVSQRPTRTQRVAQKQGVQRDVLAQKRFEGLKEKAKEIQETKFVDRTEEYDKPYTTYRPSQYSARQWDRLSQRSRDYQTNRMNKGYSIAWKLKRKQIVVHSTGTRKATRVIPFTLEDTEGTADNSYKDIYDTLDPELRQFFDTPDVVLQKKATTIATTKETIQSKLKETDLKIASEKERYAKKQSDYQDWWGRQSSKYRSDPKRRERRREKQNNWDDDLEESIAELRGYKTGLNKGVSQLNQNKNISFGDIENYAWDVGSYEESRTEARNKNSAFKRDQAFERKQLTDAGYEPFVIEKSFKGNPTGVSLSYYNPETKDFKHIADYDVKGKVDVSKMERVAFSDKQERTISWGGTDIKFKSAVGIFQDPKDTSKKLVTPYGKLDVSMDNLLTGSRTKAKMDWRKENAVAIQEFYGKPFVQPMEDTLLYDGNTGKTTKEFNFKGAFIPAKDIPFGSGGQQTVSTQPTGIILTENQLATVSEATIWDATKLAGGVFGAGWQVGKKGLGYVNENVHFDFKASPLGIQVISFGKKETVVDTAFKDFREDLAISSDVMEVWAKGGKEKIDIEEKVIQQDFNKKYQTGFEIAHMENLIDEKITFEEASSQFKESPEAKAIQKDYANEFGDLHHDLSVNTTRNKKWLAGSVRTIWGIESGISKAIDSPAGAGLVVGAVAVLPPVLSGISPKVTYGLSAGLFGYGTYKAFSPTSTIDEAGSGLVTAVISGATLGYGAYRYLKTPVVKTVTIKKPVMDTKATASIGRDLKIITKEGKEVNTVIFQNQKLSQTAQAGRRTIVTTKGRVLSNSFWREMGVKNKFITMDSNAIYRGIPTQQLGYTRDYAFFRKTKISGYDKATKLLKQYGWNDAQAKATLRYTAPKITEQYLDRGFLFVKGNKAYGEFKYLTKSPVISIDKKLGIKTKGASTIRTKYAVERKLVSTKIGGKEMELVAEQKSFIKDLLNKKGDIFSIKDMGIKRSFQLSKGRDLYKGYEPTADTGIYKQVNVKDLINMEVTSVKPYHYLKTVGKTSQTHLIKEIKNLDKNVWQKPSNIKKTPFTFDVTKETGMSSSDITKVMDKLDDVALGKGGGIRTSSQSQYYGTGAYEQSFGGLSPAQSQTLQAQLKTAIAPPVIKIGKLDNLIKIKQLSDVGLGVKLSSLLALNTATIQRSELKLKSNLKIDNLVKSVVKSDTLIKTAQLPAQKTSPALKTQLKSILDVGLDAPLINIPTFKNPPITPPRVPIKPNIPLVLWLDHQKVKKKKKKSDISGLDKLYLPDFTSRSLGLTQKVSEKNLMAKINKMQSGLEIRRGITTKKKKNVGFKLPKEIKIKW